MYCSKLKFLSVTRFSRPPPLRLRGSEWSFLTIAPSPRLPRNRCLFLRLQSSASEIARTSSSQIFFKLSDKTHLISTTVTSSLNHLSPRACVSRQAPPSESYSFHRQILATTAKMDPPEPPVPPDPPPTAAQCSGYTLSRPLHLAPPEYSTTTSSAVHSNLRQMSTSPSTTTVNHLLFISWFSPDVSSATVSNVSSCSNVNYRHKSETSRSTTPRSSEPLLLRPALPLIAPTTTEHHQLRFKAPLHAATPTAIVIPESQHHRPPARPTRHGNGCLSLLLSSPVTGHQLPCLASPLSCYGGASLQSQIAASPSFAPNGSLLLQLALSSRDSSTTHQPRHRFKMVQHVFTPDTAFLPGSQHHRRLSMLLKDYVTLVLVFWNLLMDFIKMALQKPKGSNLSNIEFFMLGIIYCQQLRLSSPSACSCYVNETWHIVVATYRFTSSALMGATLVFKTALDAALLRDIQHLKVLSDSRSLVTLLNTNGDCNELKSVLFDIRCLIETFSSISIVYVLRLANVTAYHLEKLALYSLHYAA